MKVTPFKQFLKPEQEAAGVGTYATALIMDRETEDKVIFLV